MASVGLRELRQDASRIIRRVEAGESIEVTVQGRSAAWLVPSRGGAGRSPAAGTEFLRQLNAVAPVDGEGWLAEIRSAPDPFEFADPWDPGDRDPGDQDPADAEPDPPHSGRRRQHGAPQG